MWLSTLGSIFLFAVGFSAYAQGNNVRSLCEVSLRSDKQGEYRILSSKALCGSSECVGVEYRAENLKEKGTIEFLSLADILVGRDYYLFLDRVPAEGFFMHRGGDTEGAEIIKVDTHAKFSVPSDGAYLRLGKDLVAREAPAICIGRAAECRMIYDINSSDKYPIHKIAFIASSFGSKLESCGKKKIEDLDTYGE